MVQVLKVENLLLNHNHVSLRKEFQGFWFPQLKKKPERIQPPKA